MEYLGMLAITMCIYIIGIYFIELKRRKLYKQRLLLSGIFEVDKMNGTTFEDYLESLLTQKGYKVRQTPKSNDYGADLILTSPNGKTIAVQAKRFQKKVGIKAVQEVTSAKNYYNVDECWVVTNSIFTEPAIRLGNANNVVLIDRDLLAEWMLEVKNRNLIKQ